MSKISKVKQYSSPNHSYTGYIIHDDDFKKFYIDSEYGYVEYFNSEDEAKAKLNCELKVPFAEVENYDILEIENWYGLYDDNLYCYTEERYDIWPVIAFAEDFPKDKFPNFVFPKSWETEDDYDNDDYDAAPSYYDPRYDGPFNYIPPGNH